MRAGSLRRIATAFSRKLAKKGVKGIGMFVRGDQDAGMARKLRVEYPEAIYHVMNRGDYSEPIFNDDFDRRRFIETLDEACVKTEWEIHAYWLMRNLFIWC